MSFLNYFKEKGISFLLLIFALFTIEILLMLYNFGILVKIYIPICMVIVYLISFGWDFIKRKKFYDTMFKKLQLLDQKYLICEIVGEYNFEEARLLREFFEETNKSMLEHVNEYKHAQQEYRDYIELWIHEVKTPIATSKMIIENHRNEVTQSIEEEIEKIDNYVEQTLFYARSNNLEKDYLIKPTNLSEVIHKVMLRNKKTFLNQKIQLDIREIKEVVYSDCKWLEFIMNQIISNSIKYKGQKPIIKIFCEKQKNMISLIIEDNGIGISDSDMARVFEKGFTGKNGRKHNKSTGMGLYLCQKLCQKLGHAISINSQEGKGTCVKILFPIGEFYNLTNS